MNTEKMKEVFAELRIKIGSLGYDCAGIELINENGMNILRVYLEMPGGVDLSDCETVSREVNEYLDSVENVLPERYFLEVSSPGLERPLFTPEDYRNFTGKEAHLSLKGGRKVQGVIVSSDESGTVTLSVSGEEKAFSILDIKRGHLIYVKESGQKKTFKKIPKKKK